jgi:isoquinoline 1-oxidoreductase beta subunit
MSHIDKIDRRDFLRLTGLGASGLMLTAALPSFAAGHQLDDETNPFSPNVFLSIDTNGDITIVASRSEMGQGIRTSLPQVLADELEADWGRVTIVQATADKKYGIQNTDGSISIRDFYTPMREAGATARMMLEQAAADSWQVPVSECRAELHKVVHQGGDRSLAFGELASLAAKQKVPNTADLRLKSPDQFRYIGRAMPGTDLNDICCGKAEFGIDVQLPGMLYASIVRSPVLGGSFISVDDSAALQVKGVKKVVRIPGVPGPAAFHPINGVAVIAENTWAAQQGCKALKIKWEGGKNQSHNSEAFLQTLKQDSLKPGIRARNNGDVDKAFARAEKILEAQYTVPYLAHASMEPPVATAHYQDNKCEIWAPVQTPQSAQQWVAGYLKLEPSAVTVNVTLLGGAFGRKSKPDFVIEAALLSKQLNAPVKVTWSRVDDIKHDYYHSISAQYLKAGLDAKGKTTSWLHRSLYPSIMNTFVDEHDNLGGLKQGATDMPYDIANVRVEGGKPKGAVRIGWMRSVNHIQHSFAVNSFTCELAHAAGKDPGAYLLELLGPDRMHQLGEDTHYDMEDKYPINIGRLRGVVERAMTIAKWGKPLPDGWGMGIAVLRSFHSYVATVVVVSSTHSSKIKMEKIISVADVGRVVDPDRVKSQLEGGAIFGLSLALHGNISVKDGVIEQSNFHDYPVARIHETPDIETDIIDSEHVPTGAGEPGTPPLAPALTNAVFAATGKRIRDLPLAKHGLV